MRTISEQELKDILSKHDEWLRKNGFKNPKLASSLDYSYWVCENGNIASAINPCLSLRKTPKILSKRLSSNGYRIIQFKKKNTLVHRIVAREFIGNIDGKIVHHKNRNKTDNRVKNLMVTDFSTNNKHSYKTRSKMYSAFIKQCHDAFKAGKFNQPTTKVWRMDEDT